MPENTLVNQSEQESQLLGALFQNASLGIIVINHEGKIKLANNFMLSLFGYSNISEIIGQKIEMLMPERFHKAHVNDREKYVKKPERRPMGLGIDLFGKKKNGEEFPVEISLSNYKRGEEIFAVAFISDISKRKEIEESVFRQQRELAETNVTIERLNQELENKVNFRTEQLHVTMRKLEESKDDLTKALNKEKELGDLKGRFVSMASHEFRTPLSTILSSASLLSKYSLTEEQDKRDKHIHRIKSTVTNLTTILNEFLSIGRIEDGKIIANNITFDLKELIYALCNEMNGIVKPNQKLLYTHKGDAIVFLDPSLLKNVLINLLSNAIKFAPEGSIIRISSEIKNDTIKISVKDEGIGMSDDDKKHLFERFFRGTNAINIQGTGLGLHIVGKYIELMDGKINVKSKLEEGTEILVTFHI
ncbi:MAG TPA: PAS domain-containing sensor histidine kinase [Chitinophagaceae bacterium]